MHYDDPRDTTSPFIPLPDADAREALLPVGWEAAVEYPRLLRILPSSPSALRIRDAAISAVLEKAAQCVRHAAHPTVLEEYSWPESPDGGLDLDASIDAGALLEPDDPDRLKVRVREERRADISLILDMSLSMTGEKIALVAVAATVLALKLRVEDLAVTAFDSTPTALKRLGEFLPPRDFVARILEVPARGYTHLGAGIRQGLTLLRSSRRAQRVGILMSDGVYNMGWDPTPLAARFRRLHVIHLGEGDHDKGLCRRLASHGHGRYYRAERYEDLPGMAHTLVQDLFR